MSYLKSLIYALFSLPALCNSLLATSEMTSSRGLVRLHEQFFGDTDNHRFNIISKRILEHNRFISSREIKINKFRKMSASPYNFFRATNHNFYADLETGKIRLPLNWDSADLVTWIVGDLHLGNVSYTNLADQDVNTDQLFIDDYDEAMILPVSLDLFRFLVSIELFSDELNFKFGQLKRMELLESALQEYRLKLNEQNSHLSKSDEPSDKPISTQTEDSSRKELLKKWTYARKGRRLFQAHNKSLAPVTGGFKDTLQHNWKHMLRKLPQIDALELEILDVKQRLRSGLGSLGVDKYYVLVSGPSKSVDDDRILELKEQKPTVFAINNPSLLEKFNHHYPENYALRNLNAQTAMRGILSRFQDQLQINDQFFLIREISPNDYNLKPNLVKSPKHFKQVVLKVAAKIAEYHLRARNKLYFSTAIFRSSTEKFLAKNISDLVFKSVEYAETIRSDHHLFASKISEILDEAIR